MVIELVPTLDVLAELGARRSPGQVLVGFAAETASGEELVDRGRAKLAAKGADIVVANQVGGEGAGFGSRWSNAVIVSPESATRLGLVDKATVASALVDAIATALAARRAPGQPSGISTGPTEQGAGK